MLKNIRTFESYPLLSFAMVLSLGILTATETAYAAQSTMSVESSAHDVGDVAANAHDLVQGSHVEGHIAFLKAELGITEDQEALWEPVAAAMREDVKKLDNAELKARHHKYPDDAMTYLENRVAFANLRAEGEQRFITAFGPLYMALSSHQKQVADDLLIPNSSEPSN